MSAQVTMPGNASIASIPAQCFPNSFIRFAIYLRIRMTSRLR